MPESAEEIAYCHACGSPMDVAAVVPFSNVECPHCGKHTRVKREFGCYTLLRRHAIGGMSVVFVAHDATLNREVAVKILNENHSADARRIAAFEEEARLTASFSHPHVVRVFRTGRAFGRFFIAMELVVGGHFEQRILERGTIPEREMLPLAMQVAEGLKAALAAGLIHRDIKPGNILLDGDGNAKIVDFGLALLLGKGGTAQAQEFWATSYYVPPETIEGHAEDFRSDIYAFGATLYHALAGRPPCHEESMAIPILREAKKKVLPLHTAAPWVSLPTCAVVDRAMAHDPAKRFASYDEMITHLNDALKHLRAGTSVLQGEPAGFRRRQSAKRRGERLLIGAGVAAILAALAGGVWWVTRQPLVPDDAAVPPPLDPTRPTGQAGPPSDPAAATRIANLYREARAAVASGEYDKARRLFATLRDDAAVQEPTRTWAGVEAVVMPYLDGQPGEARKEALATAAHARAAQPADPTLKECLLPVLDQLGELPPVAGEASDFAGDGVPRTMAWLLAGLKNWEQGKLAEATGFFTAVGAAELNQQDSWAAVYQKIAAAYLTDFKALSNPVFDQAPTDQESCQQAIADLDAILAVLQTRGRARFNVNAWKLDLEKQARRAVPSGASSVSTPPAPPAPFAAPLPPALVTVLEALARHAAACTFTDASTYLKSLPADAAGASRKALLALTDSAAAFIRDLAADLKGNAVNLAGRVKTGEAFTNVAGTATAGQVWVTFTSGASRECAWGELAPESLMELSRMLVRNAPSGPEKLRRREAAIAFEWLAGDRARAVTAAERLAREDAAFMARWNAIAEGLP
ncbi:MAG: serine/threonine-protein kinase [Verrucomicrobia bacterium]|nr:serine/threonine-protein kinase [Verrucomicrobiota bacterium]